MAEINWTNNHIQQEIRDTSVAAWELNANLYASGIIPQKSSKRSTGTYWEYDKAYFMSTQVATRQPGTVAPIAKYAASIATYSITQKHLSVAVTNEEIVEASDTLEPMNDASNFLGNNFVVDYEIDFANTFLADDVWEFQAAGATGASTNPIDGDVTLPIGTSGAGSFRFWNEGAAGESDPILILKQAVRTMQKQTGMRPNKLLIPRLVFDQLEENEQVKQWASLTIGVNGGDDQTKAILQKNIGSGVGGAPIDIQVVEMSYQNITSIAYANRDTQNFNFGQTSTPTFGDMEWVLETSCLLMYSGPSFSKYSRTAAACMKWDGLTDTMAGSDPSLARGSVGGGIDSTNLLIRARYVKENFTSYVDGFFAYDNNVVSPQLGFYLKNCINPATV
ncbi:MAG: hypothetical protein HRU21_09335 [Pseudomonadales bacterium]|nr:hypothetical protein [Pseudomonadales bacterium]